MGKYTHAKPSEGSGDIWRYDVPLTERESADSDISVGDRQGVVLPIGAVIT
jgi:hypothetical protein